MSQSMVSSSLTLIFKENPICWEENAICSTSLVDQDLWTSSSRNSQGEARHICLSHCPVLDECRRYYSPGSGQTAAGVTYRQGGRRDTPKPMDSQPPLAARCSLCGILS